MENSIAVEVTESGSLKCAYRTPDNNIHYFSSKDIGDTAPYVWTSFEPVKFKINALNIEKFFQHTYPIVKVTFNRKNVSKLYEWWWKGFNSFKIYDVNVAKTAEKTVTVLKMSSGNVMYVDEDISVFENALNGLSR